jgi:hypothetical protein
MKNENSVLKNIRRYFRDRVGYSLSDHIFVPMMLNFNIRSAIPRGDNHLLRYHREDITVQTDISIGILLRHKYA